MPCSLPPKPLRAQSTPRTGSAASPAPVTLSAAWMNAVNDFPGSPGFPHEVVWVCYVLFGVYWLPFEVNRKTKPFEVNLPQKQHMSLIHFRGKAEYNKNNNNLSIRFSVLKHDIKSEHLVFFCVPPICLSGRIFGPKPGFMAMINHFPYEHTVLVPCESDAEDDDFTIVLVLEKSRSLAIFFRSESRRQPQAASKRKTSRRFRF